MLRQHQTAEILLLSDLGAVYYQTAAFIKDYENNQTMLMELCEVLKGAYVRSFDSKVNAST